MKGARAQRGLTLVELVAAIVVLGVGLAGVVMTINGGVGHSADPMVEAQATAVAQAYIEEITARNFCDPDFSTTCATACTTSACGTCAGAFGPAETRATFDDMCDYDGLQNVGARDQFGNAIAQLARYTVDVDVDSAGETLNGQGSDTGALLRISVTVTHPALAAPLTLSTYRGNY